MERLGLTNLVEHVGIGTNVIVDLQEVQRLRQLLKGDIVDSLHRDGLQLIAC
jgi:hypothetical protein